MNKNIMKMILPAVVADIGLANTGCVATRYYATYPATCLETTYVTAPVVETVYIKHPVHQPIHMPPPPPRPHIAPPPPHGSESSPDAAPSLGPGKMNAAIVFRGKSRAHELFPAIVTFPLHFTSSSSCQLQNIPATAQHTSDSPIYQRQFHRPATAPIFRLARRRSVLPLSKTRSHPRHPPKNFPH